MENYNLLGQNRPVWINEQGEVICPGDSCPKDCDTTCPIWCQTLALQMGNMGMMNESINLFEKAIHIAPNYISAYVNLAVSHGQMNNHYEANRYFLVAYHLNNKYENAITGLITSYKNLGHFDEAFNYCDIYEQVSGNKAETESFRKNVREAKESQKVARRDNDITMSMDIVNMARNKLTILEPNNKMPNIPELLAERHRTCKMIFKEMKDAAKKGEKIMPTTYLLWGIYAGIGAVYHWYIGWNELKEKGVPETLLEPRGAFAMDEYVLDTIGIGFDSEEGKNINMTLYSLTLMFIAEKKEIFNDRSMVNYDIFEMMKAMYIFGMVYQMERLGLR